MTKEKNVTDTALLFPYVDNVITVLVGLNDR